MAARSGMADLILQVRRLVDDQDAAVWTDDEVQAALDRFRREVWGEALTAVPKAEDGETVYKEYLVAMRDLEGTASGAPAWRLYDSTGADVSGYTLDAARGLVSFTADQEGAARYADYRSYDPYLAAADLWEERAATHAGKYDFSAGSEHFSRSQWFDHCMEMAKIMRRKAKPILVPVVRGDVEP